MNVFHFGPWEWFKSLGKKSAPKQNACEQKLLDDVLAMIRGAIADGNRLKICAIFAQLDNRASAKVLNAMDHVERCQLTAALSSRAKT